MPHIPSRPSATALLRQIPLSFSLGHDFLFDGHVCIVSFISASFLAWGQSRLAPELISVQIPTAETVYRPSKLTVKCDTSH